MNGLSYIRSVIRISTPPSASRATAAEQLHERENSVHKQPYSVGVENIVDSGGLGLVRGAHDVAAVVLASLATRTAVLDRRHARVELLHA